jgi:hypothetical protein
MRLDSFARTASRSLRSTRISTSTASADPMTVGTHQLTLVDFFLELGLTESCHLRHIVFLITSVIKLKHTCIFRCNLEVALHTLATVKLGGITASPSLPKILGAVAGLTIEARLSFVECQGVRGGTVFTGSRHLCRVDKRNRQKKRGFVRRKRMVFYVASL